MNNDNTAEILVNDDNTADLATVQSLKVRRLALDVSAQKSSLHYLADMEAQEKKLRTRYTRIVEKALAEGDTAALLQLVKDARKHGIEL